jgi:lysozyme
MSCHKEETMSSQNACALGIDVSAWRGTVEWRQVKDAGVSFAFAKATEGTEYVDPTLAPNWAGMKQVGIIRGAYHFLQPDDDPIQQAQLFVQTVRLEVGDMPPALDLETPGNADNDRMIAVTEAWLKEVERLMNRRPMIYTGPGFWNSRLRGSNGQHPAWASNYELWVAHYTDDPQPMLPRGWNRWTIWQYSDHGAVDGVNHGNPPVDMDWFNGTVQDLLAWVGLTEAPAAQLHNQDVINAFYQVFGQGYWDRITSLGMDYLANPRSNRDKVYMGPAIKDIPGLTDDEKTSLQAALTQAQ